MLSGMRTSLIRFSLTVDSDGSCLAMVLDSRLSLSWWDEGNMAMKVHPAEAVLREAVKLDPSERDGLLKGEKSVI